MSRVRDGIQINEKVTTGPQPEREEIHHLADIGFRSVVNLRTTEECKDCMTPEEEEGEVKASNMEYLHLPVPVRDLQFKQVDEFRKRLKDLPYPIYVHCAGGPRACAFSLMHLAAEDGWSGEDTLERGEELGFHCNMEPLRQFIVRYVEEHSHE